MSFYVDERDVTLCSQVTWPQDTRLEHKLFQAIFELVVGFLLPVGVMAVCYSRLLLELLRDRTELAEGLR